MFDTHKFIEDCRECLAEIEPRRAILESLTKAVADPRSVSDALPPKTAGLTILYRSADLTIVNVIWAPKMQLFAHDHRMWACIGIYSGREDNEFFCRATGPNVGLTASNRKQLNEKDVVLLGHDTIHAVTNPLHTPTGAIHVYGGDFVAQRRSQWLQPNLTEEPYDSDLITREFTNANNTWHASVSPQRHSRSVAMGRIGGGT